ncbi:MAG: hypothetical protein C5B57_08820 [Blastocatellia bacterium]|nr:MAG: hypothetical protein C5B57_08820 [Blastocatellia bacterium]
MLPIWLASTDHLDAASSSAAGNDGSSLSAGTTWTTFSADITVKSARVNGDGQPAGTAAPAVRYRWQRKRTASGWRSTMTLLDGKGPTVHTLAGHKDLDNPFAIDRIEDDEDGTPIRVFNRRGVQVALPMGAGGSQPNTASESTPAIDRSLASAVRPMAAGRDWIESIVPSPAKAGTRRTALERQFGKAVGRTGPLDRFVTTHDGETVEILADAASALIVEMNVLRDSALVRHTTATYARQADGSFVRRALHTEQAIPGGNGERTITDVEIGNVRFEHGR